MTDPISRQAALDALEWKWAGKAAIDAIKNLPTIDTVKHGKWIKISDRNYTCTVCRSWWTVDRDSVIKDFCYCPNCGAKMDGGK